MSLSTHVLDTAAGRPAVGVAVTCARREGDRWVVVAEGTTDEDGRIPALIPSGQLAAGDHRLSFATAAWAADRGVECFWPQIDITFTVSAPDEHHHVPVLLSPYGYTTYRGS